MWIFISVLMSFNLPSSLQEVQKTFSKAHAFEVSFRQEVKQDIFPDDPEVALGRVKFTKPEHLIWTYESPRKKIIEYDGKRLLITEDGETHQIKDLGQISLQESFAFLWGKPDPKIFVLQNLGPHSFRVSPKEVKRAGFKFIDVEVRQGFVSEAKIRNALDSESTLKFNQWRLN